MTLTELHEALIALGAKPQHYRHLYRAMLGVVAWPERHDARFPKNVLEALPEIRARLEAILRLVDTQVDIDNEASAKLLFALEDGQTIESVLLPREGVCVSSQVGCAVGCVFCMTGKGGLVRQLTDLEIVAQVMRARALRPKTRKVAFMGMGEPSHNLKNVLSAITFLGTYGQIPHKNLVLSTVGDKRVFEALKDCAVKPALAVSLHTIDNARRREMLPKAARMSVEELVTAAEHYARASAYPTQYQWTLIEGLNDSAQECERLIELLAGKYAMMNFIPVNAVDGSPFKRPAPDVCAEMVRRLRNAHIVATLRDSAAQNVEGGCGQLRRRHLDSLAPIKPIS